MTYYVIPTNIYNDVHPIAQQQGVPDLIWSDVVYVESGFSPTAHNPSGAYGLFQLLTPGGQGDNAIRDGYTTNDLYDPKVNAKYGMPAVASAWNNLKGSFNPNDLHWWEQFASQSGHPGGQPGQAYTDEVAKTLMEDYQGGQSDPLTNIWNVISQAWQSGGANLKLGNAYDPNTPSVASVGGFLNSLSVDNITHVLIRSGVFIVALAIVVVGFLFVAKGPVNE